MRILISAATASALALIAAAPAVAQEQEQEQEQQQTQNSVEVLSTWNYDRIYADGWSVETMFDETEVIGADGQVIGDVENVIFGNDGEVRGIIAQVGGFWDIGDTHVHVPWDEVTPGTSIAQLTVPVTEETVDDYGVFGGYGDNQMVLTESGADTTAVVDDDLVAGSDIFKATDLIGDYAYLSDGARYGYVADLLVQDGRISAVVTDAAASGRRGYYAYPYAYRRDMMAGPGYTMPFGEAEIGSIENFDYEQLQSRNMP